MSIGLAPKPASPIHLRASAEHREAPPVVSIVGQAPIPPELNFCVGPTPLDPPVAINLQQSDTRPVEPGASFSTQKIALLSEQTHETNWILRGKARVPPPNDESQTSSGALVGPVHVANVCSKATSYLFTFHVTKSPAATACRRRLGKFVTGRAQRQSP
jgi:hypothetical protein